MTTASEQRHAPRGVVPFLAAVIAALVAILLGTTASASASVGAETRVGAFNVTGEVLVEPPEHVSAGQHPGRAEESVETVVATGVAANTVDEVAPVITKPYVRPGGATTRAQREAVQGHPCVDCGALTERQVADHIDPLVKEYYRTGTIDLQRMRSLDAVQSQCPTCSARQGADLSRFSRDMRQQLGLDP